MNNSNKRLWLSIAVSCLFSAVFSVFLNASAWMMFALGLGIGLIALLCYVLTYLYEDYKAYLQSRDYLAQQRYEAEARKESLK